MILALLWNSIPEGFILPRKWVKVIPSSSLNTACWRRMTQTGEEILGLGSEMLSAAVVLKLGLVHARFHGSHLPRGNSCTKGTTRKAKKRVLTHILSVLTHIHDQ